eukprot:PITA_09078
MVEEYASIMKNDVWEVVPCPEGKSMVTSRWFYKIKHVVDGSVEKFKARFVAWGFSRVEGVHYEETFALVARYTHIRAVISIAAKMGWRIHQMDVKTDFLNGLEVWEEDRHVFVGQGRYTGDILRRFHMDDCSPMGTPMITKWKKLHASDSELGNPTLYRQLISSLMYLVNTRSDIYFADNTLSQFMMEPRRGHWVATKHVLRYLEGNVDYGLYYVKCDGVRLIGCTNSNWAGSVSAQKSTFRCCFSLGLAVVSWFNRK